MGAFDGAEVCELVGLYLLNQVSHRLKVPSIGLYRDDGLAVMENYSGAKADKARKELIAIFKKHGLSITVETNLKVANFLDVTLDLHTETHKPYHKPNNTPVYVNINSNHPKIIIDNMQPAIERRISSLSSNRDIFHESAPIYNKALQAAGYTGNIKFKNLQKTNPEPAKQHRNKR